MMNTLKIIFAILTFISFPILSQEWGEIPDEDWLITEIKDDPDADAVVLFDIGKIFITPDFETILQRHKRIKILTEKGKDYANIEIPYWHEDKVYDLEAQSFLPDGDDFELDDDNVFEEGSEKRKILKFAVPGVEVGSIIEYKYELFSEYVTYLEPWYFQGKEYTKRSELQVYKPNGFGYNAFKTNTDIHNMEFTQSEDWDPYRSGRKIKVFKWVIKDLPAIKKEPYMYNVKDYLAHINFQIASFKNQYVNYTFIKTWDDLAEKVRKVYDKKIKTNDGVEEIIKISSMGVEDKTQIIKNLYHYVCDSITTDDKSAFLGDDVFTAEKTLEEKKGNPVEKNLLLISMLKKAGFESYPVLISTKYHGKFYPHLVNLQQFNHVLAYVKLDNNTYFVDTRNKYCPMSSLPISSAVGKGFLIQPESGKIVAVKSSRLNNNKDIETKITLNPDGSVMSEVNMTYEGYSAIETRKDIDESDQKEFIEDLIDDLYENAVLDTFQIIGMDSIYSPLKINFTFKIPDYAQSVGNMVYFSPVLITKLSDNPFKSEKRRFPVDYLYTINMSEKSKIFIPNEFKISELPAKVRSSISKISFLSLMLKFDDAIEVTRSYRRKKLTVHPGEYRELRNLYDKMVESDDAQIVLEKI